jgi:hypothetical protein
VANESPGWTSSLTGAFASASCNKNCFSCFSCFIDRIDSPSTSRPCAALPRRSTPSSRDAASCAADPRHDTPAIPSRCRAHPDTVVSVGRIGMWALDRRISRVCHPSRKSHPDHGPENGGPLRTTGLESPRGPR